MEPVAFTSEIDFYATREVVIDKVLFIGVPRHQPVTFRKSEVTELPLIFPNYGTGIIFSQTWDDRAKKSITL